VDRLVGTTPRPAHSTLALVDFLVVFFDFLVFLVVDAPSRTKTSSELG
jgi:hypothetical protein